MVVAREWYPLENGSRWRMVVAGEVAEEWYALENGSCWRMGGGAGEWEWKSLENYGKCIYERDCLRFFYSLESSLLRPKAQSWAKAI
jgi:hypothetical protein